MDVGKFIMLGDINVDCIWPVAGIPEPGRDGLVDSVKTEIGGAILNSTIVLDHMGQETILLGCVGDDLWGDHVRDAISDSNIDLSQLQIDKNTGTGLDFILVTSDGERTMFGYRGANANLRAGHISEIVFQQARLLHISGYAMLEPPQSDAVWKAVEFAQKHEVAISIDTGLEPVLQRKEAFKRLLPLLEICISGEAEAAALLGSTTPEDAAERLLASGVKIAVIKLGGRGSYIASGDAQFFSPAFPIDVKDTTGAGDSFSAGLIYGWGQGLSLATSALLASALGALATTVEGAGMSLPDQEDLATLLKSASLKRDGKSEELIQELSAHFGFRAE